MAIVNQSELHVLNESQAGRYIGVSSGVLRLWRAQQTGPRFFRAGQKLVRYRRADIDQWIEARLVRGEQFEDGSR